jgi:hypothetical protein
VSHSNNMPPREEHSEPFDSDNVDVVFVPLEDENEDECIELNIGRSTAHGLLSPLTSKRDYVPPQDAQEDASSIEEALGEMYATIDTDVVFDDTGTFDHIVLNIRPATAQRLLTLLRKVPSKRRSGPPTIADFFIADALCEIYGEGDVWVHFHPIENQKWEAHTVLSMRLTNARKLLLLLKKDSIEQRAMRFGRDPETFTAPQ